MSLELSMRRVLEAAVGLAVAVVMLPVGAIAEVVDLWLARSDVECLECGRRYAGNTPGFNRWDKHLHRRPQLGLCAGCHAGAAAIASH